MTGEVKKWPVKRHFWPVIVRWPAVILSPAMCIARRPTMICRRYSMEDSFYSRVWRLNSQNVAYQHMTSLSSFLQRLNCVTNIFVYFWLPMSFNPSSSFTAKLYGTFRNLTVYIDWFSICIFLSFNDSCRKIIVDLKCKFYSFVLTHWKCCNEYFLTFDAVMNHNCRNITGIYRE